MQGLFLVCVDLFAGSLLPMLEPSEEGNGCGFIGGAFASGLRH